MNLKDIDGAMLRKALEIYLEEAYGTARPRRKIPDFSGLRTLSEALPLMDDEVRRLQGAARSRRWVLRLGNSRYPNMKLTLDEHLMADEFVFQVDAHDDAPHLPGDPDREAWKALQGWNRAVKDRIEQRWTEAGIPTWRAPRVRPPAMVWPAGASHRGTVLVVDDEKGIGNAVEMVLRAEGYRVLRAADGVEALARAEEEIPDLVLMDFEMPRLDGAETCSRLRRNRRTRDLPVLLATAAMVDLASLAEAQGFLVKPYHREILMNFVHRLVRQRREATGAGSAGAGAAPVSREEERPARRPAEPSSPPRPSRRTGSSPPPRPASRGRPAKPSTRASFHRRPSAGRLGSGDRSSEE